MEWTKDTLPSLAESNEKFVSIFSDYAVAALGAARLYPRMSKLRLKEARGAWQNDIERVGANERHLEDGLDHFKQAGHLAFWLRRSSPVVETHDLTTNIGDAEGMPITGDERDFRNVLFSYCNEYLAFDFGLQICFYYETSKTPPSARAQGLVLPEEYYLTMCHFLKYKTVSPHAMFLIYKSIFLA